MSGSEYAPPFGSLPVGTRIRFLKTLEAGPNEDHPAIIYARKGDLGTVVDDFPCAEGHCVKWDRWSHAAFGATLGVEFEEANAELCGESAEVTG